MWVQTVIYLRDKISQSREYEKQDDKYKNRSKTNGGIAEKKLEEALQEINEKNILSPMIVLELLRNRPKSSIP